MSSKFIYIQFCLGVTLGSIIACSPTKFSQPADSISSLCDASVSSCVSQNGYTDISQGFTVGSGKVDILFVNDNSASMSKAQVQMAAKFAGFIQSLDAKRIDYRIAITTTDLNSPGLISFSNGKKYITKDDASRVSLFNSAIVRSETLGCEDLITFSFNSYGASFQSSSYYISQYPIKCPSSDTRGIYAANLMVSGNNQSLLRTDANLNIILISNDDVRQGKAMDVTDTAAAFNSMMQQKYSSKYWDFNSIIVTNNTCKEAQTLRNAANQVVVNQSGPAIAGGIGVEYANLSNSSARDIDGNPRPRGKILDICQSDYTSHFSSMATQISEDSRMMTLKCTPMASPTVARADNSSITYSWSGNKIVFPKGTEGAAVSVSYRCYTGPT